MPDVQRPQLVSIRIDDQPLSVCAGTTVAAAIVQHGKIGWRRSVSGESRGPLCGMGICFECRVMIDGTPNRLACQVLCANEMNIQTSVPIKKVEHA